MEWLQSDEIRVMEIVVVSEYQRKMFNSPVEVLKLEKIVFVENLKLQIDLCVLEIQIAEI